MMQERQAEIAAHEAALAEQQREAAATLERAQQQRLQTDRAARSVAAERAELQARTFLQVVRSAVCDPTASTDRQKYGAKRVRRKALTAVTHTQRRSLGHP